MRYTILFITLTLLDTTMFLSRDLPSLNFLNSNIRFFHKYIVRVIKKIIYKSFEKKNWNIKSIRFDKKKNIPKAGLYDIRRYKRQGHHVTHQCDARIASQMNLRQCSAEVVLLVLRINLISFWAWTKLSILIIYKNDLSDFTKKQE